MVQKSKILTQLKRYIILFIGSIIYAAGIEIFLVPNNVIDGGVVGISIMASHLTGLPLGLFLIAVNIPFIYLGYKQIGKTFTLATLFSIISLSYWTNIFLPIPGLTNDLFLTAVFGGVVLGIGVGQGGFMTGSWQRQRCILSFYHTLFLQNVDTLARKNHRQITMVF